MEVVPPDVIEYDEDGNIIEPEEEPVEEPVDPEQNSPQEDNPSTLKRVWRIIKDSLSEE